MKAIYEDPDIIVLDKPAGVLTHGSEDESLPTVVDEVRGKVDDPDPLRPGIVHRLDKDTSGVLLIAKNLPAKRWLQSQFKNRKVEKTYIGLVHGHVEHKQAVIDLPIGRHPKNPLKRAVRGNGKPAQTSYKLLKEYRNASLLELRPKTGRTHQIRVHLAHIGHPIVGDTLYGKADSNLKRHFLHASRLIIALPSGQSKSFRSPLPGDLESYLKVAS